MKISYTKNISKSFIQLSILSVYKSCLNEAKKI